jgi:hypothetical protein
LGIGSARSEVAQADAFEDSRHAPLRERAIAVQVAQIDPVRSA